MKIKAGKNWEFNISIVARVNHTDDGIKCELVTFNINKGAIIVCEVLNNKIIRAWYDAYKGPKLGDFSKTYIWNSKELNQNGNLKRDFCIKKADLEALL